jgi:hypothetical protein
LLSTHYPPGGAWSADKLLTAPRELPGRGRAMGTVDMGPPDERRCSCRCSPGCIPACHRAGPSQPRPRCSNRQKLPGPNYGPDVRHGGVNRDGSGRTSRVTEERVAGQNPVDLTARVGS